MSPKRKDGMRRELTIAQRLLPNRMPRERGRQRRGGVLLLHAVSAKYGSSCVRQSFALRCSDSLRANTRLPQPCFDHPAKKATFSVSLISPAGLISLSNTPEVTRVSSTGDFPTSDVLTSAFLAGNEGKLVDSASSACGETKEATWELISFETTPIMSSYLVAWAVGRFRLVCVSLYLREFADHL